VSEGIWVPPGGSADPRREQPSEAPPSAEPTPEQLIEEFQRIKVSDLLVSTVYTLSQIGYGKLDAKTRDLDEAKLAIDALRALLPLLRDTADPNLVRDFGQVLANMQLAYADAERRARGAEAGRRGPREGRRGRARRRRLAAWRRLCRASL
jgi:hypothetical protein